jgi:hypothetical protein
MLTFQCLSILSGFIVSLIESCESLWLNLFHCKLILYRIKFLYRDFSDIGCF